VPPPTFDVMVPVPAPLAVEVVAVDGVGGAVVVGGGAAAGDGVDLEESAGGGVVEAGTHEGGAGDRFR
jgi:hypothetical protein